MKIINEKTIVELAEDLLNRLLQKKDNIQRAIISAESFMPTVNTSTKKKLEQNVRKYNRELLKTQILCTNFETAIIEVKKILMLPDKKTGNVFPLLVERYINDDKWKEEVGREAELNRLAADQVENNWRTPIAFDDGVIDTILLGD
jgi:hypothetical protein